MLAATAPATGTTADGASVVGVGSTFTAGFTTVPEFSGVTAATVADGAELTSMLAGVVVAECFSFVVDCGGKTVAGGVLTSEVVGVPPAGMASAAVVGAAAAEVSAAACGFEDFGAVVKFESVAPVCAPPLLLIVTPGATSVVEDVAPDVDVALVVVGLLTLGVDPLLVAGAAVDDAAGSVDGAPDEPAPGGDIDAPVALEALDPPVALDALDDSEEPPAVSAVDTP